MFFLRNQAESVPNPTESFSTILVHVLVHMISAKCEEFRITSLTRPISKLPSPISKLDFDAASFPAHTRRMATICVNNRD